jgi:GTP-binding protein EngB required for normal cell division
MSAEDKTNLALDNDREWRKLLLEQNKTLFDKVDKINDNLSKKAKEDEKRFTRLEIKSSMWGIFSGILSTLGIHIWKMWK